LREASRPGRADALAVEGFGPSGGDLGGGSEDFGQQASRCVRPARHKPGQESPWPCRSRRYSTASTP
jgi:hypothetical protein